MTETSPTAPRITSVTTYGVSYPLASPMADAVHYIPARAALLVEVACDDGSVGTGESAIYGGSATATEALIHDVLAPRVLGADPTRGQTSPARADQPLTLSRCWRRSWAASSTCLWRHSEAR